MNDDTYNNIKAMVHVQAFEGMAEDQRHPVLPVFSPSSFVSDTETPHTALALLQEAVHLYGVRAFEVAEARMEAMQESFLAFLHAELHKANITLHDKLSIFLAEDQRLILQSTEDNEALLNTLAMDTELLTMFLHLQHMAVTVRGIQFLNTAEGEKGPPLPVSYHISLKGALSHFYLK